MRPRKIMTTELEKIELIDREGVEEEYWKGYRDCYIELQIALDKSSEPQIEDCVEMHIYERAMAQAETARSYTYEAISELQYVDRQIEKIIKEKKDRIERANGKLQIRHPEAERMIVDRLRSCKNCDGCDYFKSVTDTAMGYCVERLHRDAADLIEKLIEAARSKDKHLDEAKRRIKELSRSTIIEK